MTQAPAASLAEANEKVYTSLTYGIAFEQNRGGGRKNRTVRFLDFDRTAVTFKETLDRPAPRPIHHRLVEPRGRPM